MPKIKLTRRTGLGTALAGSAVVLAQDSLAQSQSSAAGPTSVPATPPAADAPKLAVGAADELHQTHTGANATLTTNQGIAISDNQNSLRVGPRGPVMLEDFVLREKIMHFDHERIPERVVHARGTGAHGYFELTDSLSDVTRADVFQRTGEQVPVFARFSTVAGNRGSTDLARDVRGFAVKFYTREGNWDLVGNNIPVFFIQDAIKFPDLIHSVKEEPDRGFPQAASAHDTFWDFISLMPESLHTVLWVMSDRGIPRSLRMIEGFGVHTFRFVDKDGASKFVKFHWRPALGLQSVIWDEAVKISGADPDFHRRDLWTAIDNGNFPEWELSVQIFDEDFARSFDFDVLDATKLIPEETVPLRKVGRMVLNKNPVNVQAETEQVAFCTANVVPGIAFTNDPLLQGRNFSYLDTQLKRLGGPNFHQIPINQPRCPMQNFQRDGHMQMAVHPGRVSYEPSDLGEGTPRENPDSGYVSVKVQESGDTLRARSKTFADHYSQAKQFFDSQSEPEKNHIVAAFTFELSKVETARVRERVLGQLANIDGTLASRVAAGLGRSGSVKAAETTTTVKVQKPSPALAILTKAKKTFEGRTLGVLVGEGADVGLIAALKKAVEAEKGNLKIVARTLEGVKGGDGSTITADMQLAGGPSVLFDAVAVVAGPTGVTLLMKEAAAKAFVADAFAHLKVIGWVKPVDPLMKAAGVIQDAGIVALDSGPEGFVDKLMSGRIWAREPLVRPIA